MIRTGRYSAQEKLHILRRCWDFGEAPAVEASLAERWQNFAINEGLRGLRRLAAENGQIDPLAASRYMEAKIEGRPGPEISADTARTIDELFDAAALEALQWTADPGEVPPLDMVRAQAGPFPVEFLAPNQRTLCLFTTAFFGRSDVIRIHDAGARDVTLVDNDGAGLDAMRLLYPESWTYITSDWRDFLRRSGERSYDLITSDGPPRFRPAVAWDHLPVIMAMCRGLFIVNYWDDMFATLGCDPGDLAGLSVAVTKKTGVPVEFLRTMRRTGPVHWAVLRHGIAS